MYPVPCALHGRAPNPCPRDPRPRASSLNLAFQTHTVTPDARPRAQVLASGEHLANGISNGPSVLITLSLLAALLWIWQADLLTMGTARVSSRSRCSTGAPTAHLAPCASSAGHHAVGNRGWPCTTSPGIFRCWLCHRLRISNAYSALLLTLMKCPSVRICGVSWPSVLT